MFLSQPHLSKLNHTRKYIMIWFSFVLFYFSNTGSLIHRLLHNILLSSWYFDIFLLSFYFCPVWSNYDQWTQLWSINKNVLFYFFRICYFFKNMDIVIAYILQESEKHVFLYVGHVSYKYSVDLFACLFGGGVRFSMSLLPLYHFVERRVWKSLTVVMWFSISPLSCISSCFRVCLSDMKIYTKVNVYYFP